MPRSSIQRHGGGRGPPPGRWPPFGWTAQPQLGEAAAPEVGSDLKEYWSTLWCLGLNLRTRTAQQSRPFGLAGLLMARALPPEGEHRGGLEGDSSVCGRGPSLVCRPPARTNRGPPPPPQQTSGPSARGVRGARTRCVLPRRASRAVGGGVGRAHAPRPPRHGPAKVCGVVCMRVEAARRSSLALGVRRARAPRAHVSS